MATSTEIIDLSAVATPDAIESLSFETIFSAFKTRFQTAWDEQRAKDPSLPAYDVSTLETDPIIILGQAWSYLRLLDRQRVNEAIRAVLAPFAGKADLEAIVASQNITRQITIPAASGSPAVYETDAQLLRRYLLSFSRFAAGSRNGLLYHAYSAVPALSDAAVNGHAVHGRAGDSDLVVIGPDGRAVTDGEAGLIRDLAFSDSNYPEAIGGYLIPATRLEYDIEISLGISATGASIELARSAAEERVRAAALLRQRIGGEIPPGLLAGAAYGTNIRKVNAPTPVVIEPEAYTVPILRTLTVSVA